MFMSKRKEVGIRVPDNKICQAILEQIKQPIGQRSSLKNEDEFLEYFSDPYEIQSDWQDKVDIIVAGGNSIMEPSTIIDCTGPMSLSLSVKAQANSIKALKTSF